MNDLLNPIHLLIYTPSFLPDCNCRVIKPTHPQAHKHSHIKGRRQVAFSLHVFYAKLKIAFVDVLGLAYSGFTGKQWVFLNKPERIWGCGETVCVCI